MSGTAFRGHSGACLAVVLGTVLAVPALAHSPVLSCFQNKDLTVTCEAGFSDGASAQGSKLLVVTLEQRLLLQGEVGADGTFTYTPPADDLYEIHMIADESHALTLVSDEIVPYED